jgi:hypothetical protein
MDSEGFFRWKFQNFRSGRYFVRILFYQYSLIATLNVFAAISPSARAFKETLNTLRFAQRAKHIVNQPVITCMKTISFHSLIYSLFLGGERGSKC